MNYCKSIGLIEPNEIQLPDGETFQYVALLDNIKHYINHQAVKQSINIANETSYSS